jgi:hypothetical protein
MEFAMKISVVFPLFKLEPVPLAVRSYAQVMEDQDFSHLHVNNHVLGANTERRGVMFHSGANIIGSGSKRD